jgi:predicted kinase
LVIVAGLPASGKSTLAERIASELGWPLFTKDCFKEQLYDAGSFERNQFDRSASGVLGAQATAILLDVASTLVQAGVSVVIESNFRLHLARRDLGPLLEFAQGRQVHCTLERSVLIDRSRSRFEHRERHPVHLDNVAIHELEDQIDAGFGEPLPLDAPLLRVDTLDGYDPDLPEILAFCHC